MTAVGTQCQV